MDNGSSHVAKKTKAWLATHPRFHVHHTPKHASWLNQVVRHEVACDEWRSLKGDRLMSVT